jgi:hypothetical protein
MEYRGQDMCKQAKGRPTIARRSASLSLIAFLVIGWCELTLNKKCDQCRTRKVRIPYGSIGRWVTNFLCRSVAIEDGLVGSVSLLDAIALIARCNQIPLHLSKGC